MPMFRRFHVANLPSTPIERIASADDASNSLPSMPTTPTTPSSPQSPGENCDPASKGSGRWNNRRRRRGAPRNVEKRPYHSPTHVSPPHDKPMTKNDMYFALDCEMVGVGPEGLESALARVTICNWAEKIVLDTFVKVPVKVTDYRTFVSGIEAKDLESDKALSLAEVRKTVKSILHGKILIGHALENDLSALQITHPWHDIRDTASYPPFMKKGGSDKAALRPRKLKELVRDRLGRDIQNLGVAHDPIEDARSALSLYKTERLEWEKWVMKQVASARVQEGRESEPSPSGRDSPPFRFPSTPPGNGPSPEIASFTQAYPVYFRSRSAPTTMMSPHQGYNHLAFGHQAYYPQQHYLY